MSTDSVTVFSISDDNVAIIMQIAFTYLYKPMKEITYRDSWSNEGTYVYYYQSMHQFLLCFQCIV